MEMAAKQETAGFCPDPILHQIFPSGSSICNQLTYSNGIKGEYITHIHGQFDLPEHQMSGCKKGNLTADIFNKTACLESLLDLPLLPPITALEHDFDIPLESKPPIVYLPPMCGIQYGPTNATIEPIEPSFIKKENFDPMSMIPPYPHSGEFACASTVCTEIEKQMSSESVVEHVLEAKIQDEKKLKPKEVSQIDLVISNVVCTFSVGCRLNLRVIAFNCSDVVFGKSLVTMQLRKPYTTATIRSSGKIICTGATSEAHAKIAARRYARRIQKLGYKVHFEDFTVVNVLGVCSLPWSMNIFAFATRYRSETSYEPELNPGVTYRLKSPKATINIFSTGKITVTASSVSLVQAAVEHSLPRLYEFRSKKRNESSGIPLKSGTECS